MTDSERRQQILEAAMRVFSTHGFHKASIKQIAKEARVKSSALIYWYFKDKNELFLAVITELSPLANFPVIKPEMRQSAMELPPRELLQFIGNTFLNMQEDPQTAQLIRLYLAESVISAEIANIVGEFQLKALNFLVEYLQHQIEIGNLRSHDVQISARTFIGSLVAYLFNNNIFLSLRTGLPDRQTYIDGVADTLLKGLEP